MQWLNDLAAATNGADGIPSIVRAAKSGEDSSVTTAGGGRDKDSSTKKMKALWRTIDEHGKKMVSAAKMKCSQQERDHRYAMQAETRASGLYPQSQGQDEADDDSNASGEGKK